MKSSDQRQQDLQTQSNQAFEIQSRMTGEDLRFILGLKLKSLRQDRGLTLQALADR